MADSLRLIWLMVRLAAALGIFIIRLVWIYAAAKTSFWAVLFLLVWLLLASWFANRSSLQWQSSLQKYWEELTLYERHQRLTAIEYWQGIVDQQPTHRDALLHLAWYTCEDDQLERCYQAWQTAVKVDPNHPDVKAFEKVYSAAAGSSD